MCLLGSSGDCYIPMVTPIAFCSGDMGPASGLGLPSSCQANLWLLDYCPDSEGDAPSGPPRTCPAGGALWSCCDPCDPAAVGTTRGTCDTASGGPRPRHGPRAQTVGRTTRVCALSSCTPAARQTLTSGPLCLGQLSGAPVSSRLLPYHCRPHSLGYRSYQTLGFTPSSFSPSCYVAGGCQSQNYWMRNCPSPRYRPTSCAPRSYFSGNLGCLSSMPSSFPPLRYLRPGCYW